MNDNLFRLELLPNEIFFELFQYFDAQDLFHAFYNLNSRFNRLLQSSDHLQLIYSMKQSNINQIDNIVSSYVCTLIIDLKHKLSQMNLDRIFHLEHLILLHSG